MPEKRLFWLQGSLFTYADKIKAPLLLIHGRLVMLPFESHGYSARESVLDVLAESFFWADTYVKNRHN